MRLSTRHLVLASVGVAALALVAVVARVSMGAGLEGGNGPVITLDDGWNAYPTAMVAGRLDLRDGCLLLGDEVVFWPHHTTWDADRQAVQFDGDFRGAAPAHVGQEFSGGGGFFSSEDLRRTDGVDVDSLLRCVRATNADGAVLAYP